MMNLMRRSAVVGAAFVVLVVGSGPSAAMPEAPAARPSLRQRLLKRADGSGKKLLLVSFNGGGLMGAFSLEMYGRLERSLQKRLGPTFRLRDHVAAVAGTSTGSLIAAGLASGLEVEQVRTAYQKGDRVFPQTGPKPLRNILSLFRAKYTNKGLKEVLGEHFDAKQTLGELNIPLLVPSVEMNRKRDEARNEGCVFGAVYQTVCELGSAPKVPVAEALLASSAAPTYLPMVDTPGQQGGAGRNRRLNADGALFANDPSMELWAHVKQAAREARVELHGERDLAMLTFGTGRLPERPGSVNAGRGKLGWLLGQADVIEVFMNTQSDSVHRQLKLGLGDSYKRLDDWMPRADMKIDDPKVVRELETFVANNPKLLAQIEKTADWVVDQLDLAALARR